MVVDHSNVCRIHARGAPYCPARLDVH
jgi:hypothetical protein